MQIIDNQVIRIQMQGGAGKWKPRQSCLEVTKAAKKHVAGTDVIEHHFVLSLHLDSLFLCNLFFYFLIYSDILYKYIMRAPWMERH